MQEKLLAKLNQPILSVCKLPYFSVTLLNMLFLKLLRWFAAWDIWVSTDFNWFLRFFVW